MAFDDLNKERLAFVSGNILICGLLSVQLWPVVSLYQTGMHINFWTDSDPGGTVIGNEYWIFSSLTRFLAVLASAGILAICYLLVQGVRLGITGKAAKEAENKVEAFLHNVSEKIYGAIFLLGLCLIWGFILTPLIMLVVHLERVLALYLHLSATLVGWILRLGLLLLGTVLAAYIAEKINKASRTNKVLESFKPFGRATVIIVIVMLVFMSPIVDQLCYTAEIEIERDVVDRSQCKAFQVYVTLGGATSDLNMANLKLIDPSGTDQQGILTTLSNLGDGRYIAFIPCEKISNGLYQVSLEYPHLTIVSSPPFITSKIHKSKKFYVFS